MGAVIGVAIGALRFAGSPSALAASSIGVAGFMLVLFLLMFWSMHPSAVLVSEAEVRVRRRTGDRLLPRSDFKELILAIPPKEEAKPPDARVYDVTIVRMNGRYFRVGVVSAQIARVLLKASPGNRSTLLARRGHEPTEI
ncbi:MAG TPA: hypothetical protein VEO20_02195 [Thermoplasmata archaeon]|nr:hypothetical protein [Thermoplasmata archaeon]